MTAAERAEVRVVREALEGVLSPSLTSAVLFEALGADREIPESNEDLLALVRGGLADVLEGRLGRAEAATVVGRIEELLDEHTRTQPRADVPDLGAPNARDLEATTAVPTGTEPVRVGVVAGTGGFASRLALALGPSRVAPETVPDPAELSTWTTAPAIALVDGTDIAPVDPPRIAEGLRSLPGTTTVVVWASELPYGRAVSKALDDAEVEAVRLRRREGIEPLLDLIRSRRRA